MSEVVTQIGRFDLTEFEQEYSVEIQDLVSLVPGSRGFVKRIVAAQPSLNYDRVVWLISKSPMIQVYLGIEIQKRLDEAEGVIADVLEGTVVVKPQRLETAKWYLKQMGRTRGYTDGVKSLSPPGGGGPVNFQVNFVSPNDADKALVIEQGPKATGRPKSKATGAAPTVEIIDLDKKPELF